MKVELDTATEQLLQEKLKQRLLEVGLLSEIKPPLPPHAIPRDRQPHFVQGNPVSELIIKERR
ncbi:MAG: hypothetical protein JNM56_24320 [Planctomycetia bacterium]|nr:hypothetical protein [Planctomycetia bacterium]